MLRILLIAPHFDKNVPGESWSTFKWVEGISRCCAVTVLTTHSRNWSQTNSPTDSIEVIDWPDLTLPNHFARINHEMNPGYLVFYLRARRWIKQRIRNGWDFDLVHQINPLALRYPSPAAGLGIPYVIGPLAGSLITPSGFTTEGADRQWFRKLRHLDKFRLRFDPYLNRTYAGAELILGVAPYVKDLLEPCRIKQFAALSETGIDSVLPVRQSARRAGEPLRLLFVGRVIRTKGVVDAIRAVALAGEKFPLHFDIIGDGDHMLACRAEVERLGMQNHIHFHGWLPRSDLDEWYCNAHVFLFPSFREPSGNVIFESMRNGLPVITCSVGGPGYVVDESCGIRVSPTNPRDYAIALAGAISELASDSGRLLLMSNAAIKRLEKIGLWENKIKEVTSLYQEVVHRQK